MWQGTFISEVQARRLMAGPSYFLEMEDEIRWRRLSVENIARLVTEQRQLFARPPDQLYLVGFKLHFDNDFLRIYKNNTGRTIWYLMCVRREDVHFATRVLQVSQPRFEQHHFKFTVTGMNGDVVGEYAFKSGERVTVKELISKARMDLDEQTRGRVEAVHNLTRTPK